MPINKIYSADITAGSLLLAETRTIASLLLEGKSFQEISNLVEAQNVLQKRSTASATRIYSLIKHRLETMDKDLWSMIVYGDSETARLSTLAVTIKDSRILGDFMFFVLKEKYQLFEKSLPKVLWDRFIDDCKMKIPDMPSWTEKTAQKIGDCVYRILAETGYINNTKEALLQKVYVPRELKNYLNQHDESYVLRCMEVSL